MTTPASPSLASLAQRLTLILGRVQAAVAGRGGRDRAMVPLTLILMVWARMDRLAARFEALVARLVAGRPFPPYRRRPRPTYVVVRPAGALRLPTCWAWLVREMPETAALGTQLQALLAEPEMAALLAAAPQAGRILRPLCRMLAVEPGPPLSAPQPPKARRRKRLSAIGLIWAALIDPAPAVAPDRMRPVMRKPPWCGGLPGLKPV